MARLRRTGGQDALGLRGIGLQLGEALLEGLQQLDHGLGGVRLERPVLAVAAGERLGLSSVAAARIDRLATPVWPLGRSAPRIRCP